jgi:hypothetical protein
MACSSDTLWLFEEREARTHLLLFVCWCFCSDRMPIW